MSDFDIDSPILSRARPHFAQQATPPDGWEVRSDESYSHPVYGVVRYDSVDGLFRWLPPISIAHRVASVASADRRECCRAAAIAYVADADMLEDDDA